MVERGTTIKKGPLLPCSTVTGERVVRLRLRARRQTHTHLALHQVSQQSNSLNGLAQAHFISQDAVQVVVVQRHHPLQPLHLITVPLPKKVTGELHSTAQHTPPTTTHSPLQRAADEHLGLLLHLGSHLVQAIIVRHLLLLLR